MDPHDQIGMRIFLRCTCMAGMTPRKVFERDADSKKTLRTLLAEGMKAMCVHPLDRRVFQRCDLPQLNNHLATKTTVSVALVALNDETEAPKMRQSMRRIGYKCDKERNYVIISDDSQQWTHLSEWLVHNGAADITIVSRGAATASRRLQLLEKHHGARIQLRPDTPFNSERLSQILKKASPLSHVFVLLRETSSAEERCAAARAADVALNVSGGRPTLVCAWPDPGPRYRSMGAHIPVCNISWEDNRSFRDAVCLLDRILLVGGDVLLTNEKAVQQDKGTSAKDLKLVLPKGLAQVRRLAEEPLARLQLRQLTSSCPKVVREIPPLFVAGGLAGQRCPRLRAMALHLMYPVQCARFTTPKSISELADQFVREIVREQPRGPYNLLGICWGGALVLEVARRLEASGSQTRLFLIDAVPDILQTMLNAHADQKTLDAAILSQLLSVEDVGPLDDWEQMLGRALGAVTRPERPAVAEVVCRLRNLLGLLSSYEYSGQMINGPTALFRPQLASKDDSCGLTKVRSFFYQVLELKILLVFANERKKMEHTWVLYLKISLFTCW